LCIKFAELKIELHITSSIVKMETREKRPRIADTKYKSERQEATFVEGRLNNNSWTIEDKSWAKGRMPDIGFDDLWLKDTHEQNEMIGYQIEAEVKQSDHIIYLQSDSLYDTKYLKDIYNTLDYDHAI
jgi:hypothetical protein